MSGDHCLMDMALDSDEVISRLEPVRAELSSSDEEAVHGPPVHRPRVARASSAAAGHVAGGGPQAVAVPPVPPPPKPGVPPVARASPVFIGRVCRVQRWPRLLHSEGDKKTPNAVRMSQTWGSDIWDFRAVCQCHDGARCEIARNGMSWRPLGRMWVWFDAGRCFSHRRNTRCTCRRSVNGNMRG